MSEKKKWEEEKQEKVMNKGSSQNKSQQALIFTLQESCNVTLEAEKRKQKQKHGLEQLTTKNTYKSEVQKKK